MSDETSALSTAELPWHWEWVPAVSADEPEPGDWIDHVVGLFEEWTAENLAELRASWPTDAPGEFPITSDMAGRQAAGWLLARAAELPAWSRLAWGAVFVDGRPRWAPVPVVVEFCEPLAPDPNYLMVTVGAGGVEGDAREPVVDYVTTPLGDGLRVFALCRSAEGAAFARVDAALRLDVPPTGQEPGVSTDVVLTTRVFEMGLMAVIGTGIERLMQQTADECAPAAGGPARLGFVVTSEEAHA